MNTVPASFPRRRARARIDDAVVAESARAVVVERDGAPPILCFPNDDVRRDARDVEAAMLSLEAELPTADWLADHVAFDQDRVAVELIDVVGGLESVKRFPVWGDAADLIDILDLRPDADNRFVSVTRSDSRRPVVEGSQILGQAIVAAGRHSPGRRVVSGHLVMTRVADAREPLSFDLTEMQDGRTFTTLGVNVTQGDRCCATGTLLLDVGAPDVMRHATPMPDAPGPEACSAYDMGVTGRDLRIVDDAYTDDPDAPVGPPVIDAWVRFDPAAFHAVGDDGYVHAGLLAQFTGHLSIAAAMRPHAGIGQRDAHRTLSTAINAIGLSLHADIRADEWMLYHHETTFAGDGMTHSTCRVHARDGALLASFTVDAMVRAMPTSMGEADERTVL